MYSYQKLVTNTQANISFLRLFCFIMQIMTNMSQHLNEKQTCFMKKNRYFTCEKRDHSAYYSSEKSKIVTISESISKDNKSQEKNSSF